MIGKRKRAGDGRSFEKNAMAARSRIGCPNYRVESTETSGGPQSRKAPETCPAFVEIHQHGGEGGNLSKSGMIPIPSLNPKDGFPRIE